MSSADSARGCSEPQQHEIRVVGHLDSRWAAVLENFALTHERDGTTTLSGPLADQAALHGLLARIRDLGLPIVSIRRVCPDSTKEGRA